MTLFASRAGAALTPRLIVELKNAVQSMTSPGPEPTGESTRVSGPPLTGALAPAREPRRRPVAATGPDAPAGRVPAPVRADLRAGAARGPGDRGWRPR